MNIHQERIELATQTEQTFQLTGDSLIDDMTREKDLVSSVMKYCAQVLKFEDNVSIETKVLTLFVLIEGTLKRIPEVLNQLANARAIQAEFEKILKFQSQFNDAHQGSDLYKANKNQDPETCAQFYQLVRDFVVYLAKAFPQDRNKQPTKFKLLLDTLNEARVRLPAQATLIVPFAQSGGIKRSKGNRDQGQRPNQQHQQHQRQNDDQARKIQEVQLDIQESITNIHSTLTECDGDGRDQIEFIEDVCGTYVKVMQNSDKKLKGILDDLRAHPDVIPREQLLILQSMKRLCEQYPAIFHEFSGSAKNFNNYRQFKDKVLRLTNPALGFAPHEEDPALHQFDQKEKQKRDEEARRERIRREEEERLKEMEEERLQRLKEDEERSLREKKKREEEKLKKEQQLKEEQQKKEEEKKKQEQKQREEQLLKAQQERVEKERLEREKREKEQANDQFIKPRIAESYMHSIPEDSESRRSYDARDIKNSQPGSYRQDQRNQYQYPPLNQFEEGGKTFNPDDQDDDFQQPQQKPNSMYPSTQIHSKIGQSNQQSQQSRYPQHEPNNQYNYPPQQQQSQYEGQSQITKTKQPSSVSSNQPSKAYNNNQSSQDQQQSAPYNQSFFPVESQAQSHHPRQGPNNSQFTQQPGSLLTAVNINKMSFGGGENLHPQPNRENYMQNFDTMSQVSNISYQQPHYPELKEKNHSGRLVRFDQKQFRIFNESRQTESQIRRWKNASFKGQGSLVENPDVQIGTVQELSYNSLARRYALKISIYYGNKTNQPLQRVQNHFEGENDTHLWTKNESISETIAPGSQIVQEVIVGFSKPDYRFINGVFQSADHSGHIQKQQWVLPMSLFSFFDFKDIDPRIFKPKWKNLQSFCVKSESFPLNQKIYKSVDIFRATIPKLCELVSSRYFNNQIASTQNFRCYKLGGMFELLNGEYMLKLIIYPNMRFLVKLSSQHHAIEHVLHNICFIFQQ